MTIRCLTYALLTITLLIRGDISFARTKSSGQSRNRKLLLIGGGKMPAEGIKKFMEWAGGDQARLLVIPWASELNAEEILKNFENGISGNSSKSILLAPLLPEMASKSKEFLELLKNSTAVFFVGGDQNNVMDFLDKNTAITGALLAAYSSGKPFGGTSAGAAIMSKTMLTGNADLTVIDPTKVTVRRGLGVLSQVVVDQHFIKLQRLNRLLSVMAGTQEKFALGVDEGASVAIEGQCHAKVLGPLQAILLQKDASSKSYKLTVQQPGSTFDLGCGGNL